MRLLSDHTDDGVRERRIDVVRDAGSGPGVTGYRRVIPTLLFTPAGSTGTRPLVLIGHGGSGSKRQEYVLALAHRFVRHHDFAAASIDGPVHGDRSVDGGADARLAFFEFAKMWAGDESMTDEMVDDWRATLAALRELDDVGPGPTGYWGLSMGTILGLPFVACEPLIEVAVLGLMGLTGPTGSRIAEEAPKISCPVLFLVQWSDELFARDQAFALFDRIGSPDKRLHANPGFHGAVPDDEFAETERFLAERLGRAASPSRSPHRGA